MQRILSKIGKVLFHRLGIVAVLIIAQIILYIMGLVVLRDSVYFDRVEWFSWCFLCCPQLGLWGIRATQVIR